MFKNILLTVLILFSGKVIYGQEFFAYYTRTSFEDGISDKHADIIVSYGDKGKVVFSRESNFLPRWEPDKKSFYFNEIVKRTGNGPDIRPDQYNIHSYVRIIENSPDKIMVQWRYYPHILKTEMTDVVHEFFTFFPDGHVIREIKPGTKKIEEWESLKYQYAYRLSLEKDGIKTISTDKSKYRKETEVIQGNPIIENKTSELAAYWPFNEGMEKGGDEVTEPVTNIAVPVLGHKTYWIPGVSGTALKFDGYFSGVQFPGNYSPRISGEFTIEAWINMAAHPFGWAPVVHQSNWKGAGYYLGVNARGNIGFLCNISGQWIELITDRTITNFKWTHVAVTFNADSRKLIVYIDGQQEAETEVDKRDWSHLIHANAPLSIGLNTDKMIALPRERYVYGQYPCITGFEGAIDEVKFYHETLSQKDLKKSYERITSAIELDKKIFKDRVLPGHPGYAKKFGARYAKFNYHPLWDDAWRTSDYPDILVKFDELPTSVTFWRGPSYGAGWVTDKNYWLIDQSVESGNAVSYGEHMSDKQGRYSHVRLIENTDARVVIHWRYNSNDVLYSFLKQYGDAGVWVDEYMTIYPDGVGIRKVKQKAISGNVKRKAIDWEDRRVQKISWQDVQFASQPGMTPDDVMNLEAVHLANMKGETAKMDWTNGVPKENPLPSANIELINFKSDYKVFLAFQEGTFINPWGRVPRNMYCHFMTWNHWPVAFITSQGKSSLFPDRITHSALCAADNAIDHGNMAMYGFTNKSVESLVPLVKSWNNPPDLINVKGCTSKGYDKDQRAYVLNDPANKLSFTIKASRKQPFVNNGIVVKKWKDRGEVACIIDGKKLQKGKEFRQGIFYDTDGIQTLVLFLKMKVENKIIVQIKTIN